MDMEWIWWVWSFFTFGNVYLAMALIQFGIFSAGYSSWMDTPFSFFWRSLAVSLVWPLWWVFRLLAPREV